MDFDALVPQHVQDNYRALVAERHDGDWSKLARHFDANGEELLARWAASHADTKVDKPEKAVEKTPRTTRGAKSA